MFKRHKLRIVWVFICASWKCCLVYYLTPDAFSCPLSCGSCGGLDPVCDRCTWRGHRGRHPWQVLRVWRNQEPASQPWPQNRLPQGETNNPASLACLWVSVVFHFMEEMFTFSRCGLVVYFVVFLGTGSRPLVCFNKLLMGFLPLQYNQVFKVCHF